MQNIEFTTGQIKPIECLKEGFELIKKDYWLLFAISLVGAMIGGITMYVLIGAMICGIFMSYLRVIDGGRANFDDLFKGIKYWQRSLVATIVIIVPVVIYIFGAFMMIYLPVIMKAVGGTRVSNGEALTSFFVAMGVEMVIAIVMVIIHSLLIFTFPLIVDKDLSSIDAIKLSARAAIKNIGGIAGLFAVNFVIGIAGALVCIGTYFIIPIVTAASIVAYRKVFPGKFVSKFDTPPPSLYQQN